MTDRDIFLAVLDLPENAARNSYLESACGGDAARRARVEALLRAHAAAGSFLAEPAVAVESGKTQAFGATSALESETDESLNFLSPSQRPDSLGRISHYEVLEILGRGGFGIVLRAFDDVLQRVVAVKVLALEMAATSPARKRFLREARSSAQVRHENVVQVYAVEEQPLPYLVMEFIPGETLQQRLDRTGPLDVPEVLRIGRQIAEGLAAAHAQGLIHRDIKPANVLIEGGARRRVMLTDFGLARAADDASISQSGIVAGTPMYMAPEQARGETLDHRADLFSLGSVMYAMLTGHSPFRAGTTLAVLKRVTEDEPRPIREVIPEVPEWLCRIVGKLLAKDQAERFQSARDVADLLADCETQWKAHGGLKDFSRIPGGRPPKRKRPATRGEWIAVGCAVAITLLAVWLGPSGLLYLGNQGRLELMPRDGLVSLIVLENDEGILDGNKLHAPVTDWLNMNEIHRLKLPPGRYQINAGANGKHIPSWEVTTAGPFGSERRLLPGEGLMGWSVIVAVGRGERVTVRALVRDEPGAAVRPGPAPVSIAGTWESDRGPVTLEHGPFGEWTVIGLSGFYSIDKNKTSVITRGKYDLETRTIDFSSDEPWRRGTTSAHLKLSSDGNTLEGAWHNDNGENGRWTMTRGQSSAVVSSTTTGSSDLMNIQGTWSGVTADVYGQQVPDLVLKAVGPTVTFAGDKVTWKANPAPESKDPLSQMLAKFSVEGVYHLDPTKSPKTIDLMVLGQNVRTPIGTPAPRALLGIYKLDGDTLEICIAIDPEHAEERPGKFQSVPGKFISHIKLHRRQPAASPAAVQALRDLVAAKERTAKVTDLRFEAGQASPGERLTAQVDLVEARIRLAEAEGNRAAVLNRLTELVKFREEEQKLTSVLVEVGRAARGELDQATARVAEARVRLAQAEAAGDGVSAPAKKP